MPRYISAVKVYHEYFLALLNQRSAATRVNTGCRTSVKNTFCLKLANSSTRDNCLRNVLFTCLSNLQLNKVTSSCQSVPLEQRAYIISEIILGRTHKCP